jgi:parallel beta-helix repeat protein
VTDVYAASGGTAYAIYGSYCNNLTIAQNTVFSNLCSGILVTNSLGFAISNNYVHSNAGYGINTNASMNGRITQNDAFENSYDGIGLGLGSANCTVVGNNATENAIYGIWVESSSEGNHIYDNNIIGNNKQASVSSVNEWDNGFEGNYWSDYVGLDEDRNGIGDTPYSIDQNHSDNYPLMGPSMFYMTSRGSDVGVVSNSSIKAFAYYESNSSIIMHVLNKTESQTGGFCRIRIPHALMIEPYNASVDGAAPTYSNITLYDDGNSRWIYLSYQRSEREILIQGNPPPTNAGPFPYWILAVIAGVAVAMIIVAFYALSLRRKRAKTKSRS